MPIVLDTSVTIARLMPDEASTVARLAHEQLLQDEGRVPGIWWFEVRNVLLVNEWRGRIDAERVDALLSALRRLPIVVDRSADEGKLMALARTFRLTVYDAAYLELAQRLQVPLATLDKRLLAAAHASGVTCIGAARD